MLKEIKSAASVNRAAWDKPEVRRLSVGHAEAGVPAPSDGALAGS
jgi:hypothetical protein